MSQRIVIDPVTRIEGHLRIELETDADATVTAAYAAGTMVRGIERILVGRDPREAWAFAQRACGVCTLVHAIASVRAVEDALSIRIPPAASLVRNLMIAQQYAHDHVMHFYHLHALDWVDVPRALEADPGATAALQQQISPWPNNTTEHFAGVQARVKTLLESGQPSLFGSGYWGHPAYNLPPAVVLLAVAHYLEALTWQAGATTIHTVFGGKNPHPNFVVGGVPSPIDLTASDAVNAERLELVRLSIEDIIRFVTQVYVPDVLAIAGFYKDAAQGGEGLGTFMTWGEFPSGDAGDLAGLLVPRALIAGRDLDHLVVPDPRDTARLKESVARSWYRYASGAAEGLHPWQGETDLHYTGPRPPYEYLDVAGAYSWLKAPRMDGRAVEVGPLARILVMYASGHAGVRTQVDGALDQLQLPFSALYSTLGRTLARAIETQLFAEAMRGWFDTLLSLAAAGPVDTFNGERWDPATWPGRASGFGFMEAPRGALGHWIVIEGGKIANYQMVVPTTWNASPRDQAGTPGAYEAALVGTRLARPDWPLEALRTVHSFDPCLACAVH
jgi:hydrogenase large subunit